MFVWASFPQSETFQQHFTFQDQELNFSWLPCFHFTGYTFVEKQPFPNNFFILESCSRKTHVDFLFDARELRSYFTAHTCFRARVKTCAKVKIPTKVKTFLSIGSLQRATHNICLYCPVVWKMSSQILT